MARIDNEIRITLSLLDRLIDTEPNMSQEPISSRLRSLEYFKQSVKRDLEWLFNTRRNPTELPDGLKELAHSLAVYGLPDFSAINVKSPADQQRLERELESVIRIFEPRLEDPIVNLEPMPENERALHFRINARLRVEPTPEPVSFDTVLRLDSGRYLVKEE